MNNLIPLLARLIFFGSILSISIGCSIENAAQQNDLVLLQSQLDQKIFNLQEIEKQVSKIDQIEKGDFLHEVYFNFKTDLTEKEKANFIKILSELKTIDEAKGTQIGIPKDTGDKRMRTDYDLVLHMSFNNMQDYKTYQNHETHLSVKKRIGGMLAGPPFVYDYEIK